jgi:hypothetical protein
VVDINLRSPDSVQTVHKNPSDAYSQIPAAVRVRRRAAPRLDAGLRWTPPTPSRGRSTVAPSCSASAPPFPTAKISTQPIAAQY